MNIDPWIATSNIHIALVSIDAGINKFETILNNGVVVEHLATHDPVTANEAFKMRSDVNLRAAGPVGEVQMSTNRRVCCKGFDR